jgi:hypothetical protein
MDAALQEPSTQHAQSLHKNHLTAPEAPSYIACYTPKDARTEYGCCASVPERAASNSRVCFQCSELNPVDCGTMSLVSTDSIAPTVSAPSKMQMQVSLLHLDHDSPSHS